MARDDERVGDDENRRRVHDDQVEVLAELCDQGGKPIAGQKVAGYDREANKAV